jgi:histidinol-phosphate/aromatic aminotransferase/cobyric acid decarboxylase-like protein
MTDRDLLAENGRLRFRIVELEEALAEARKVIEPFAQTAHALQVGSKALDDDDHLQVRTRVEHLRAARAWLQANKVDA